MRRRAVFVLFPGCEILDVAGPAQTVHEAAITAGMPYEVVHAGITPEVATAQGLVAASLQPLPDPAPSDWIFIPGYPVGRVRPPAPLVRWVRRAHDAGAAICSVCTGAFLLGEAGLLDGRRCTTHWRRVDELHRRFPRARVTGDRLFVTDGPVTTSAGIASGIDMTLALLERDGGPALASEVAREMVVYLRRDGAQPQESVYLDYQHHLNPAVHRVQQYLIRNPTARDSLEDLGRQVGMSSRNLTRVFRRATGTSINDYRVRLRLEHAKSLLRNPALTLEAVSSACGFADARQLRRLFRNRFGASPRRFRSGDHAG